MLSVILVQQSVLDVLYYLVEHTGDIVEVLICLFPLINIECFLVILPRLQQQVKQNQLHEQEINYLRFLCGFVHSQVPMHFRNTYSLQLFRCQNSIVDKSAMLAKYMHNLNYLLERRILNQVLQALDENL